jgi:hypothetical protein
MLCKLAHRYRMVPPSPPHNLDIHHHRYFREEWRLLGCYAVWLM